MSFLLYQLNLKLEFYNTAKYSNHGYNQLYVLIVRDGTQKHTDDVV